MLAVALGGAAIIVTLRSAHRGRLPGCRTGDARRTRRWHREGRPEAGPLVMVLLPARHWRTLPRFSVTFAARRCPSKPAGRFCRRAEPGANGIATFVAWPRSGRAARRQLIILARSLTDQLNLTMPPRRGACVETRLWPVAGLRRATGFACAGCRRDAGLSGCDACGSVSGRAGTWAGGSSSRNR